MPVFAYEAVDKSGQRVKKELDAASKDDAIKQLKAQGLRPTKITLRSSGEGGKKKPLVLFSRVSLQQITTFTRTSQWKLPSKSPMDTSEPTTAWETETGNLR